MIPGLRDNTAREGPIGKDSQNRTGTIGQVELDRQNRTTG
jgi:hypothetical protein